MTKSVIFASTPTGTGQGDNLTYYWALGGASGNDTTNANRWVELPIRTAGTFRNMAVYVSGGINASSSFTLRKSQVDTSVSVAVSNNQTGYLEDTTNTSSFANTDEASIKLVTGNTGPATTLSHTAIWLEYDPTDTAVTLSAPGVTGGTATTGSSDTDSTISSWHLWTNAAARFDVNVPAAVTGSNMAVYVTANAASATRQYVIRDAGTNSSVVASVGTTQTGWFEDTTNTVSVSAGDNVSYRYVFGTGTGGNTIGHVSAQFTSSAGNFILPSSNSSLTTVATGVTSYYPIAGISVASATEAPVAWLPRFNFTWSKLACYCDSNALGAGNTATIRSRVNLGNGNQTITLSNAQTGEFSDASNSDSVTGDGTNEVAIQVVNAGSGNVVFQWFSSLGNSSSVAAIKDFIQSHGFIAFAR